jgi:hypothetical protein
VLLCQEYSTYDPTNYWKEASIEEFIGEEQLEDSRKFQAIVAKRLALLCITLLVIMLV